MKHTPAAKGTHVADRQCRGCAFGPTPDDDTRGEKNRTLPVMKAQAEEEDGNVLIGFRCHRTVFLNDIRGCLGLPPEGDIQCRGAMDHFDLTRTLVEQPIEPTDESFENLIRRGAAHGPNGPGNI